MKTVVVMSDMHCGSRVGLTPPDWQASAGSEYGKLQRLCWDFFAQNLPASVDAVFVVGDAIDGKGERSGGTEQITCDRREQARMAAECVRTVKAGEVFVVYGTGYHTGRDEDWEAVMCDHLRASGQTVTLGNHETVQVGGTVFDLKHKVGKGVPALEKERRDLIDWFISGQRPLADVILRAHIHRFRYLGGKDWLAVSMPALQGLGSKYGARECSGLIDFGFLVFKVGVDKADYTFDPRLIHMSAMKTRVLKV